MFSTVFLWTTLSWAIPPSLDQFYIPPDPRGGLIISDNQTVAQTFTIGLGAVLTAVEIEVGCCGFGTPSDDLLVEIRTTLPDGSPSEDVLASTVLRSKHLPIGSFALVRFRLWSDQFLVSPGEIYAIALSTTAPAGSGLNPYAWTTTGDFATAHYDRGEGYIDFGTGDGFQVLDQYWSLRPTAKLGTSPKRGEG